jgi:ubiquinol oxidase
MDLNVKRVSNKKTLTGILYFQPLLAYRTIKHLAGENDGTYANVPAPKVALDYWKLPADARLRDVILVVRADEADHRDLNHRFADELSAGCRS